MPQYLRVELMEMRRLKHDNIFPFHGSSMIFADFCLVSPWYENGNIMDYLEKKPDANRFDLVRPFGRTSYPRCLPAPMNSYQMPPGDWTFYTRAVRRAVAS